MSTGFITTMTFWYILILIIATVVLFHFSRSFYVPLFIGGMLMVLGVRRGVFPPWISVMVFMTLLGALAGGLIHFIMGGSA